MTVSPGQMFVGPETAIDIEPVGLGLTITVKILLQKTESVSHAFSRITHAEIVIVYVPKVVGKNVFID